MRPPEDPWSVSVCLYDRRYYWSGPRYGYAERRRFFRNYVRMKLATRWGLTSGTTQAERWDDSAGEFEVFVIYWFLRRGDSRYFDDGPAQRAWVEAIVSEYLQYLMPIFHEHNTELRQNKPVEINNTFIFYKRTSKSHYEYFSFYNLLSLILQVKHLCPYRFF